MSDPTGRLGFFFEQTIMFQLKNGLSIHLLHTSVMECLNSAKLAQRCDLKPALVLCICLHHIQHVVSYWLPADEFLL